MRTETARSFGFASRACSIKSAMTNAMRHAFPEGRKGRVRVKLHAKGGGLMTLIVEDDGIGMPPKRRAGSLGLRLIEMFGRQTNGKVVMEGGSGGDGTKVLVTFPTPNNWFFRTLRGRLGAGF